MNYLGLLLRWYSRILRSVYSFRVVVCEFCVSHLSRCYIVILFIQLIKCHILQCMWLFVFLYKQKAQVFLFSSELFWSNVVCKLFTFSTNQGTLGQFQPNMSQWSLGGGMWSLFKSKGRLLYLREIIKKR